MENIVINKNLTVADLEDGFLKDMFKSGNAYVKDGYVMLRIDCMEGDGEYDNKLCKADSLDKYGKIAIDINK